MVAYRSDADLRRKVEQDLARRGEASTIRNAPFALSSYGKDLPWNSVRPRRGYMIRFNTMKHAEVVFQFMWNPGIVSTGYATNPALGDFEQYTAEENGEGMNGFMPTGRSLSFDLLIDRVAEVAGPRDPNPDHPSHKGVQHDIEVFEQLMGIQREGGPPIPVMVGITFGPGGPFRPSPENPLFYGKVDSAGVTYTFFSSDMVPTRCNLAIQMSRSLSPGDVGLPGISADINRVHGDYQHQPTVDQILRDQPATTNTGAPSAGSSAFGAGGGGGFVVR